MRPVFKTKNSPANTITGPINWATETFVSAIGPAPASRKNAWAAAHIAKAGAVPLNSTRRAGMGRRARRIEMTRLSIATVTIPAAGPNSRAAAIVKLSEIEKLTGVPGNRSVADPLSTVRPTSTNQRSSTGALPSCHSEARITRLPAAAIAGRNSRSIFFAAMSIKRACGADTQSSELRHRVDECVSPQHRVAPHGTCQIVVTPDDGLTESRTTCSVGRNVPGDAI